MTFAERAAAAATALVLGVQVIGPLRQLAQPRPARFGWQMYAGMSEPVGFTMVFADGATEAVALGDYLAFYRGDIAVSRLIPPAACAREPGVVEIHYRVPPEREDRVFRCAR